MIFDGLNSRAFLERYRALELNSVKIRKIGRHYLTVLSLTLIPDINLFAPTQCDIGPGLNIHIH